MMKLYLKYLKVNIDIWLNYFFDFIFLMLSSLFNLFSSIFIVIVLFNNTKEIGGWSKYEVLFLLGFIYGVRFVFNTFFINIIGLSNLIRSGKFDLFLTRPISPFFQVLTSERYNTEFPIDELLASILLIAISSKHLEGYFNWLYYILLIGISTVVNVSINTILGSLSFWLVKFDSAFSIKEGFDSISEYPLSIYPKPIRLLMYTIIPVALTSYFPVKIILGKEILTREYIISLLIFLVLILLARFIWKYGIINYKSPNS